MSIIIPSSKTVYQALYDKILSPSSNKKQNFTIYQKIFVQNSQRLAHEINSVYQKQSSSINVFVPSDEAFSISLNKSQIDSLLNDQICGLKFVLYNMVFEEVCPTQLLRYRLNYSSIKQKAKFETLYENNSQTIYFNKQRVSLIRSNVHAASNGVIYRLSTLNLNGVVDFLNDIVIKHKNKLSSFFFNSLSSDWLDLVKIQSNNSTLILPVESGSSLLNNLTNKIDIRDYLIKPKYYLYELNDGDLLKSLSNRTYLINTYNYASQFQTMNRFISSRNFLKKSVNCQALESTDLNACNSNMIWFRSTLNAIPPLNNQNILDFISQNSNFHHYNRLIQKCGHQCKDILVSLSETNNIALGKKRGYTVLIPGTEYFEKATNNFEKLSKDVNVFKQLMLSNIYYGTRCFIHFNAASNKMENLLGRKVLTKKVHERISDSNHFYLSEKGILIYKTEIF
jgi:hypothetical protein